MNDLSRLYSLGGSHVCASLFLGIYCGLFDESQIYLKLRKLQGEWVLAFGALKYGIVFSHNQYVLKLEGWLDEENDHLGYWFGTREITSLI